MPSRLRRPPVPETPDFWDRLEAELRRRANAIPKASLRRNIWLARLRPITRPIVHGAMAIVVVAMMGALGLPRSTSTSGLEDVRSNPTRLHGWVPVVEVEDPRAPVVFYAAIDGAPRFTSFIESPGRKPVPVFEDLSTV
jgi:hypothetical protein